MSESIAALETQGNVFQKYLIPPESKIVIFLMQKAGELGKNKNFFKSRVFSVALVVAAVVLSFFNAISYLLQIPVKLLLNICRFDPVSFVKNFVEDLSSFARSVVFVSLGVTFVVAGFLFPAEVFSHFAPEEESEALSQRENERLKDQNNQLKKDRDLTIDAASHLIRDLEKEVQKLNEENRELKKQIQESKQKP